MNEKELLEKYYDESESESESGDGDGSGYGEIKK